jgi:hypothetical protein
VTKHSCVQHIDMTTRRMFSDMDTGHPVTSPYTARKRSHPVEDPNLNGSTERYESLSPNERHQLDRSDNDTNLDSSGRSRKKSEPVKSACGQCQKRKTKCSGQRPTCGFCSNRGLDCSWEIGDGLTRNADLRQRLVEANSYTVDINMLVNEMRTNTDAIATTLLAKLRLGDSIEDLATGIRDGTSFAGKRTYTQGKASPLQTSRG